MNGVLGSPPSAKRIKLEDIYPPAKDADTEKEMDTTADLEGGDESEVEEDNCSICLQELVDRTVIPKCSHEFCFECLLVWTEQSRRCPLCTQTIGDYLIHSIRSRYDYRKHYLPPLRKSPPPSRPARSNPILQNTREFTRRRRREREWGPRRRENDESDKLERSIQMRRWIYRHDVYAKHVASNAFTKYRPYPTPAQFSASQELISRTTTFLRRELQVWEGLDVEFLTTLIISLMKSIDIRSESAVKLIAEFLDMDVPYTPGGRLVNAEHFAHEVYCYVRSPYKDLFVYDSVVQYDSPRDMSPPPNQQQDHRSRPPVSREYPGLSHPRQEGSSQAEPSSQIPERSESWSPSGRKYSPPPEIKDVDIHDSYGSILASGGRDMEGSRSQRQKEGSQHERRHSEDGISRKRNMSPSNDYDITSSSSRTRLADSSYVVFAEPVTQANVKGKQRAYDRRTASPPGFSDFGENINAESSRTVYTTSAEQTTHNDVDASQAHAASSSDNNTTKLPRSSRNRSFFDTIKAHLARNIPTAALTVSDANKHLTVNDEVRKGQAQSSPADDRQTSTGLHRADDWRANAELARKFKGDDTLEFADGEMSSRRVSLDKQSHSGNLQGGAREGLDPEPKIPGTQLNMRAAHSIGEDLLINTLNNHKAALDNAAALRPPDAGSHSRACAAGPRRALERQMGPQPPGGLPAAEEGEQREAAHATSRPSHQQPISQTLGNERCHGHEDGQLQTQTQTQTRTQAQLPSQLPLPLQLQLQLHPEPQSQPQPQPLASSPSAGPHVSRVVQHQMQNHCLEQAQTESHASCPIGCVGHAISNAIGEPDRFSAPPWPRSRSRALELEHEQGQGQGQERERERARLGLLERLERERGQARGGGVDAARRGGGGGTLVPELSGQDARGREVNGAGAGGHLGVEGGGVAVSGGAGVVAIEARAREAQLRQRAKLRARLAAEKRRGIGLGL